MKALKDKDALVRQSASYTLGLISKAAALDKNAVPALVEALNDQAILKERRRSELQFSAGYYAALDDTGGSLTAKDLIGRSMEALRAARVGDPGSGGSGTILPFHSA